MTIKVKSLKVTSTEGNADDISAEGNVDDGNIIDGIDGNE